MAYPIGEFDPATISRAFELAVFNKESQQETPVGGISLEKGVPSKRADMRFAGDLWTGQTGYNGQFAQAVGDPGDQTVKDKIGKWAEYFAMGPYGPEAVGVQS